jgi:hypothetical protein
MRKTFLLFGASALLSACYFVHQEKFEQSVHSWIRIDMPFSLAISILGTKGMRCTGDHPWDYPTAMRVYERAGFCVYDVRHEAPGML